MIIITLLLSCLGVLICLYLSWLIILKLIWVCGTNIAFLQPLSILLFSFDFTDSDFGLPILIELLLLARILVKVEFIKKFSLLRFLVCFEERLRFFPSCQLFTNFIILIA